MARHIWSVLCHKAAVDKDTNQISILDVMETLSVEFVAEAGSSPENVKLAIPVALQFASFWTRSNIEHGEKVRARVSLTSPGGEASGSSVFEVDLLNFTNARVIIKIPGVSVSQSGRHWFVVEHNDEHEWREVSRIPFDVVLTIVEGDRAPA